MDRLLIDEIKNTKNDEEIKELIDSIILECLEELKELNINPEEQQVLGRDSDINPTDYHITEITSKKINFDIRPAWVGFIPNNTKIVYGIYITSNGLISNRGKYYYLNDNTYLYEFAKFIKDKEIESEGDFICLLSFFLKGFLEKTINRENRTTIHKLLYKNENIFYNPTKEHTNKDFIGNGSAECTEYSSLAQNILSVFDFQTMYLLDEGHAYNLVSFDDKTYLIDLTKPVAVVDINHTIIGELPFVAEIDDVTTDYLNRLIYGDEQIELQEYFELFINKKLYRYPIKGKRIYKVHGTRKDLLKEERCNIYETSRKNKKM